MRRVHPAAGDGSAADFTFGMELIMDIDGCDPEVIADPDALRSYTIELVEQLEMKRFGETWLHHFGHAKAVTTGYTVFQPIETSSIVLHVSEGLGRVHANVFSCQPFDARRAMDYGERYFCGKDTTYTILPR